MRFITLLITFALLIGGYLWSMSYVSQKKDADIYYVTHLYKATEIKRELQSKGYDIPLSVVMYHEKLTSFRDWQGYFKHIRPERSYWTWTLTVPETDQLFLLNLLSIEHDSKQGFSQDP